LTDIAHEVGTAKSNLARYFQSREHIYLIILQQEGAAWEKRVLPPLEKLAGKGTVKKVADIISDSFIQSEWYSMLITVINSVLEKNLSPQLVVNFRSVFHRRRMRFATGGCSRASAGRYLPSDSPNVCRGGGVLATWSSLAGKGTNAGTTRICSPEGRLQEGNDPIFAHTFRVRRPLKKL
jgi:AcrR family transcriptional regulator